MRFENAVAIGDVTFRWYRARDVSKNAEHSVEQRIDGRAEEAKASWTDRVANFALIRRRAWGAVRCTVVRCSSATASLVASWTQLFPQHRTAVYGEHRSPRVAAVARVVLALRLLRFKTAAVTDLDRTPLQRALA